LTIKTQVLKFQKYNFKETTNFDLVLILAKNTFFSTYPTLFALLGSKGFYSAI